MKRWHITLGLWVVVIVAGVTIASWSLVKLVSQADVRLDQFLNR